MAPVKIVHLINSLSSGGAQTMLSRLLPAMEQHQFRNVVVSMLDGGTLRARIEAAGTPVYSLGMRPGRPTPAAVKRLATVLRLERPQILQTWLYHADLLGLSTAWLTGTPTVIWNIRASNMDLARYHRLTAWTVRACAGLSGKPRAVIVNSAAGQAFHARIGYRPREWVLIPNGIDLEKFKPDAAVRAAVRRELGIQPDMMLIGLIARFDPMKDHRTFFQAAASLSRRQSDARFLLAGEGVTPENEALSQLIEDGELRGKVQLLGERSDLDRLTAALDIATSSSCFGEGFPNVIGEAMACAVPCVATDVGDAAHIVGDTGRIVLPRDPQALAAAWEHLAGCGAEGRQALGRRAREQIVGSYGLSRSAWQYEQLYRRLAS